ncbi:MAG TPA: hypothetical protein PKD99_04510 [Sphingopyxis sp.]|nr:hypothetical protein [Sphingopyxis sp.]HMP44347.1 hypothetical protein [Sphingopyxis sp.]HMQ20008.1 hypothetical protein [Sphingopyxis sp.]
MTHRHIRHSAAVAAVLAIAGCSAVPTPAPAPAPTPVAVAPAPTPAPAPRPPARPWDERTLDSGEWRYNAGTRTAVFAQPAVTAPLVTLACSGGGIDLSAGLGAAGETLDVDLKTSAGSDRLRLTAGRVALPARDVRLDRIAFSRGRFALEASNGSTLTLPVQAEIGRLIEDCRG